MLRFYKTLVPSVLAIAGLLCLAQTEGKKAPEKKPPARLTFKSKQGDVAFDHAAHVKRAKGECKTCHDKLWPQSATAPLNYKLAMHKTAEAKQTACGFCHHPGGASFESKANCAKCHHKAGAAEKK